MFFPLICEGSVIGPRFVMHYLVSFLVSQSSEAIVYNDVIVLIIFRQKNK